MYSVGMADYQGYAGFGVNNPNEVADLNKALSMTNQSPRMTGADALRPESLEATLRILTFSQDHFRLWKDIPKMPAYSTSEEYNVQLNYGGDVGLFTRKGEAPQVVDTTYDRRVALVKYMGVQGEVPHPDTLVRTAHGNLVALETANKGLKLIAGVERALYFGRSDIVTESWDGIDQQVRQDGAAGPNNVIDLRGAPLLQQHVEEGVNIVQEAYGKSTDLYVAPRAYSDLCKDFYAKQRVMLPSPAQGAVGMAIDALNTSVGPIRPKVNTFLRSGKDNGNKKPPASQQAVRAPSTPTLGLANHSSQNSQFALADVGTYYYVVTALNRFGESAASTEQSLAPSAALDAITLTITDTGGEPATGYRVYRSKIGGAAGTEEFCFEVPRVGAAASTTVDDTNRFLPGTSRAYLVQNNLQALSFRQLGPMLKIPFATQAVSIRWAQVLYGVPICYAVQKIIVYDNVADD